MEKDILRKIKKYQRIIIYRHHRPDGDALGSQFGLKAALKLHFPQKEIYAVGDPSSMYQDFKMDEVSPDLYPDALVIICDTAVSHLVSDDLYLKAKEVIIIDHHNNQSDIYAAIVYIKPAYASACEVITMLLRKWKFKFNQEIATYLMLGAISDSGRYLYVTPYNASASFEIASFLTKFNPDLKGIYQTLYTDTLARRKAAAIFNFFDLTPHMVAYRKNTQALIDQSKLDHQSVSRGMVNNMSGIKEVPIWASFTYHKETDKVIAELRSRNITIVDIAKKYGGGGHDFACGATLDSFEVADQMLKDLDERAKQNHA